jgi:hypothetical protein
MGQLDEWFKILVASGLPSAFGGQGQLGQWQQNAALGNALGAAQQSQMQNLMAQQAQINQLHNQALQQAMGIPNWIPFSIRNGYAVGIDPATGRQDPRQLLKDLNLEVGEEWLPDA